MTTLWFQRALLPEGWRSQVRVTLESGRIAQVETGSAPLRDDERHGFALPGLGNLHSHAFQRAIAGRTERRGDQADDFWLWRERMYAVAGAVQPQELQAIAALAYAEMLQSGFVRVGEFHYLHHAPDGAPYANPAEMAEAIAAAAEATGIGLTLLPVFYAHSGFGGADPTRAQRRFVTDLDSYARLLEGSARAVGRLADGRLGLAPHSLRAVTPEELQAVVQILPEAPVHIHIAEQTGEVEACLAWSGVRPVAWLLDNAPVDRRWCLVHATHVDDAELAAIAAREAVVGLCPITEANLGDGVFPAARFLELGGRAGVGSDSNVRIDATEELRLLEYGQRLVHRGRNLLGTANEPTADRLYRLAIAGAGQALGGPVPALQAGAEATFITLSATHPAFACADNDEILSRWLFAAGRGAVDGVWVRGRQQVRGGCHLRWAAIAEQHRTAMARLAQRAAA